MILACQNISKAFGTDEIIQHASFHIEEYEKAAIVGINGAGKTTLLRIIMGELEADEGEVVLAKNKTIGYLPQNPDIAGNRTIYEEVLSAREELTAMQQELISMEQEMSRAKGEALEKLMDATGKTRVVSTHKLFYLKLDGVLIITLRDQLLSQKTHIRFDIGNVLRCRGQDRCAQNASVIIELDLVEERSSRCLGEADTASSANVESHGLACPLEVIRSKSLTKGGAPHQHIDKLDRLSDIVCERVELRRTKTRFGRRKARRLGKLAPRGVDPRKSGRHIRARTCLFASEISCTVIDSILLDR